MRNSSGGRLLYINCICRNGIRKQRISRDHVNLRRHGVRGLFRVTRNCRTFCSGLFSTSTSLLASSSSLWLFVSFSWGRIFSGFLHWQSTRVHRDRLMIPSHYIVLKPALQKLWLTSAAYLAQSFQGFNIQTFIWYLNASFYSFLLEWPTSPAKRIKKAFSV